MQVLFYPTFPELELYTIIAVFNHLDYFATLDPEANFDFAVAWQDQTWTDPNPVLDRIAETHLVLNHRCTDISKQKVEAVSRQVCGYDTLIDPLTYQGLCVKKPNENAAERGTIIQCPISREDDQYVYQAHIDTRDAAGLRNEYRVPVVFGEIPCVYLQQKEHHPENAKTVPLNTTLLTADEVFSVEEQKQISQFCETIGMDFGDLDILRDKHSQKMYIIDANKTGGGFGLLNRFKWAVNDRKEAIRQIANLFEAHIRNRL